MLNRLKLFFALGKADALIKKGETEKALELLQKLLHRASSDHELTAELYQRIGKTQTSRGRHREAKQAYISGLFLARNHELDAWSYHFLKALAHAQSELGEQEEAEATLRERLRYLESSGLSKRPDFDDFLGNSCTDLSSVLRTRRKFDEAEAFALRAVEIRRRQSGEGFRLNPQLANALNNLGTVYLGLGRLEQALEVFEEQHAILRTLVEISPARHIKLYANALNNLGTNLLYRREFRKALTIYCESFAVLKKGFELRKATFADLGSNCLNIGNTLINLNEPALARRWTQESLRLYDLSFEAESPKVQKQIFNATNNLAICYGREGDIEKARDCLERCLDIGRRLCAIDRSAYGDQRAMAAGNCAIFCRDEGLFSRALDLANESLEIRTEQAHADSPSARKELAVAQLHVAIALIHLGRLDQAEPYIRPSMAIREGLAKEDPQAYGTLLATVLNNFAYYHRLSRQFEKAKETYLSAMDVADSLDPSDAEIGVSLLPSIKSGLARAYRLLGEYSEAEIVLAEVITKRLEQFSQTPARWAPNLAFELLEKAELYRQIGKDESEPKVEADKLCRLIYRSMFEGYDWSDLKPSTDAIEGINLEDWAVAQAPQLPWEKKKWI